jgi:hypothetical protein
MQDPLLYNDIKNVPINVIQECVSKATRIPLEVMLAKTRKREIVGARQISMSLSKRFTKFSLAYIGKEHGGKDHATVLHAVKTIQNLLDTKNMDVTKEYADSVKNISDWNGKRTDIIRVPTLPQLYKKKRILLVELNEVYDNIAKLEKITISTDLVKKWIKNHVPLEIRAFYIKIYKNQTKQL